MRNPSSFATRTAEAPSLIWLAFPAVKPIGALPVIHVDSHLGRNLRSLHISCGAAIIILTLAITVNTATIGLLCEKVIAI